MRRPPPLTHAPRYPATAGTILLAIAATLAWWGKANVSFLLEDAHLAHGQMWRLFSSVLLHADPFHLIFNVYWLWVFGSLIEEHLGSLRTFALYLFLAAGSGAAEYAILDGGVGLSGVGYGLFGMLWVLTWLGRPARALARSGEIEDRVAADDARARRPSHGDGARPFSDAIDQKTIALFVFWFFLCIALTVTGVWAVANIAHAVGALLGAMIGWIMTEPRAIRRIYSASAAVLLLILLACATIGRPVINRSPERGKQEAYIGYDALEHDRPAEAARWFRDSVRMRPAAADNWFFLGMAYSQLKDYPNALDAFEHANRLKPDDPAITTAYEGTRRYVESTR